MATDIWVLDVEERLCVRTTIEVTVTESKDGECNRCHPQLEHVFARIIIMNSREFSNSLAIE